MKNHEEILLVNQSQLIKGRAIMLEFSTNLDGDQALELLTSTIDLVRIFNEDIVAIAEEMSYEDLSFTPTGLDVDFAIKYVILEKQKKENDSNYVIFSEEFFDDSDVGSNYGSQQNPVLLPTIGFTYVYLENLVKLLSERIEYTRKGNIRKDAGIILDRYIVTNTFTREQVDIFVNPYAKMYSKAIPPSLILWKPDL